MTRYDPHPQAHDDARSTPSGFTDRRESDETGPGVPEVGGGLHEALEALRKRPCENYEAPQDCITAGPQVLAAEGCGPCVARASQAPREALEALAVRFDASADNLQRAIRNQRPEPARRLSREWSQRAEAWRLAAHALRAVLAAHPADAPEAPEPSGDVVEQATQVLYDVHGAEPRIKAHALADAGLLVDPEVSERAERLPRLYRDLDGMRLLRDEAVGERDRARHLAADMEARVAELEAENWDLVKERDRAIVEQRPLVDSLIEARRQRDKAEKSLHRVRRALDDEEANLADDGARLSHAVVRRLRAALSDGATR